MAVDVLWFKKDLRVKDHHPLNEAAKSSNNLLCLFLVEPERLELEDTDPIHIEWELDNADELAKSLATIGGHLHIKFESAIGALQSIHEEFEIDRILSHQETGNSWSYHRDLQVKEWCNSNNVEWLEFPSNGVIRGLRDRDLWKKKRDSRMRIELQSPPNLEGKCIPISITFDRTSIGLNPRKLSIQREPGESSAAIRLADFLEHEGKNFQWGISSPVNAVKFGSGLSPYLTVGAISMRRVVQTTNDRMHEIRTNPGIVDDAKMWLKSLASFRKRLAWRCHFIQKLEMESDLDLVAQNKIIDSNLNREMDEERFTRWKTGTTGWPFLDACMRQLASTGWINFRMRAMIMSAASYNLWLPWRDTGCHLAKQFIDYEPGIHWSQVGMQSGTTGINTIRAYSMTKQGKDQDPKGDYIRKWIPELSMIPTKYIHEPWKMPIEVQENVSCLIDTHYPSPIVDEVTSRKEGVKRSYAARSTKESRTQSKLVLQKHGSRTSPRKRRPKKDKSVQQKLF